MTIKNFQIEYDAINRRNTFTNGDTINGRIILEVNKKTRIQSLVFKAKGKASACWTQHYRHDPSDVWFSDEKYYSIKEDILKEAKENGSEVIEKGRHVFPFSFKIPKGKIPSSFWSVFGKVIHKLKAELKQPLMVTRKAKIHFTFVSKADTSIPGLMVPQHVRKEKSIAFSPGSVTMDAFTMKKGYLPGEDMKVIVKVNNHSTRSVQPKFVLYEKRSFFGLNRSKIETREILRAKAEAVHSCSGLTTVKKVMTIPKELPPSILNCNLIKLEYKLKIYLDILCASDPEVKLSVVILPDESPDSLPPAYESFGFENQPSQSNTLQADNPPPSYDVFETYPLFPATENQIEIYRLSDRQSSTIL
ncbi:arrestin domain-containing protein 3 isoform X1 [Austrofundulus limnaeus]|uniref:Arrestin domain-containing protein 3-like isoform X1 n=1 Tax=Austrofundulus limnaeus TaxID=52670 RepID=A0A2I4B7Y1_AUSLI|nr:PREDICTED: arrestin domain-containing protein 3-like isoform X1 [Austrofundulus limnaeus]XP_013863850.1 PREDICTED: arrestin domain-containing protein 3-like isoform X1 [Austrofundulus limnaeus]